MKKRLMAGDRMRMTRRRRRWHTSKNKTTGQDPQTLIKLDELDALQGGSARLVDTNGDYIIDNPEPAPGNN